jgi:ethanolamine utilization protein EutN
MKLGKVIGKVWAVKKVNQLEGVRLLIVQPVSSLGKNAGTPIVAADPKNLAANGDRVVYVTNTDASDAFESDTPVNASIVELVDFVE